MKRTSFIGARAALSLAAGLLLAGVATPAAAVNCATGEPVAVIKGDPVQSFADFTQNQAGVWSPATVQLDNQDGANGSKPNNGAIAWSQLSGPTVTLVPFANDKVKFSAPDVGPSGASLVFQLAVSCTRNGGNVTATDTVTVNITDAYSPSTNRAPSASASANPANANDGATVTLVGSGSDPDGNPISFEWTQTDGPAVTLANSNAAITTFVAPNTSSSNGATLKFRLRVSDGSLSSTSDVTVNVIWVNDPPVALLACPLSLLELNEGQGFVLDGSASSDTEAGSLNYAWSGGPWTTLTTPWDGTPTLSLGNITGNVANLTAPLLTFGQVGKFTYRLTVTDAGGLYTFKECDIFVHDVTKPLIDVPDDIIAEADSAVGAIIGPDRGYVVSAFDAVDGSLPLVNTSSYFMCAPAPGALFALDQSTPVACIAHDSAGNEATAGFFVTVQDKTAPLIEVPLSFAVEATGPEGAAANYVAKSNDIVDGEKDALCVPASGSVFPINSPGPVTTVTCNATDAHNNKATERTFEVAVHDETPPAFDPASVSPDLLAEASAPTGATVTFSLPMANDLVDLGNVVVTCVPASGSEFPLGDTAVSCNAIDTRGNSTRDETPPTSVGFKVTVRDTTPPVITGVPTDQTLEALSAAGAPFAYLLPAAMDAVDGIRPVTCANAPALALPGVFPLGTTTVTCSASDTRGNAGSKSFTVTVVDTTPPTLTVPANITAEATGPNGAAVTFSVSASDLVDASVDVTCSANSGDTFALDVTTTVTCSAKDDAGNTASGSFTVRVQDTTGPVISPHGNITATATGNSSTVVNYAVPTAYDLVDGAVPVTCTPPPGSSFSVGTTQVNCEAYDSHHNESAYSGFTVTVSYNFTGFFQPVDNWPSLNTVKAGSAVPVKFSLGGNQGLDIFQSPPASGAIACGATDGAAIEETVTAGSSSLQFDATSNQYIYVWKTEKAWVGQCRILQIKLKDGSAAKLALFKFK
jgi:hypothetical protein